MIIQLTSGAIQYGVPMVVLLLPRVFSTTAEIPREEEKEVRRKGMSKGRDERRGEMEEIEEKKGDGGEGGGRSSGIAKAGPGWARAQPKLVPLMSCDLAQSASVVSIMV